MKAVAVRELKNRLSGYLREVALGEIVLVTDRGRVVAELRRPTSESHLSPTDRALAKIEAAGLLTPGLPHEPGIYRRTKVHITRPIDDLLDEERGER